MLVEVNAYVAVPPAWCADVEFLSYLPPSYVEEGGGVDPMWVDTMEMIDGDLHWLLQLPQQTFWYQVGKPLSLMCQVYREVTVVSNVSFLVLFPFSTFD